jgi:hypothetical protein
MDETFSKGDPKAAVAGSADDADYWLNFGGPTTKGKKDLTKDLTAWFKAFPDQKWTTVNAWGIDGYAIVEHTMSGTQKGPMGPWPATNKPVTSWHFVDIYQPTADGKLQHGWGYANTAEALYQTGALKMPGEKPAGKEPAAKDAVKPGAAAKPAAPAGGAVKPADAPKPAAPPGGAPKPAEPPKPAAK